MGQEPAAAVAAHDAEPRRQVPEGVLLVKSLTPTTSSKPANTAVEALTKTTGCCEEKGLAVESHLCVVGQYIAILGIYLIIFYAFVVFLRGT